MSPKVGCPGGNFGSGGGPEGSPPDGSFGTTPEAGAAPGGGQAQGQELLSKAMLIALTLWVVGIGLLAERLD